MKSSELNEDGKSLKNPSRSERSASYEQFTSPLNTGKRAGFDAHVYFYQSDEAETKFAKELWERIRREFPELRIYKVYDRPLGPRKCFDSRSVETTVLTAS